MRRVIEKGLINFRVSSNIDGGTLEGDDNFEDDDSSMSLESTENSVFKEKSKGMSKESSITVYSSDVFRMCSTTLLYFIFMQISFYMAY